MGKALKKKLNGMSWWMKTSLVLLLTLATSIFMYNGWYKPLAVQAATVTYGMQTDATTNVGIDGTCNMTQTVAPTAKTTMVTPVTTAATSYRPTSGMTMGNPTIMIKSYGPVYASAQTITAPSGNFGVRGYNTSDTWTAHIYDYNPAGTAGNKTLMYSSNTLTSGTGATVQFIPTYTLVGSSTIAAGHRLLVEIVYTPSGATMTPRIYMDGTAAGAWCQLTVTETVAAVGNLTVGNGTNPANANAGQGSTGNAIDGFTMAMSSGTGTVSTLTVLGDANFTATNIPTNGVKIYRDSGTTVGALDAGDVLLNTTSPAISGNATTITLTSAESVSATAANYLVVVNTNAGATIGNAFSATISTVTGSGLGTPVDSDTTGATLTITAGNVLTVGDGSAILNNTNAARSGSYAVDTFTLATSSGTSTVSTITVTGGGTGFTTTNIPTNGVKIYRDAGTIGVLDGADTMISASSTAIATSASTVTLTTPESVSTTAGNYLVVVDIAAAATIGQTITANVSALTGSGFVSTTDNDATSATLTVAAAQTLNIGNGTNPANANIKTGASAALNSFSLAINSGTGTVNTLTLTGSANFTTANITGAAVYVDNGTAGTYEAGTDTLVPTSYGQTGTVGTITFTTPLSVTTAAKNYLVLVTASNSATLSQTFTGTITGATGVGVVTASDTNSATLTIIAGPVSTITSCGGCHGNPPVDSATRASGQFVGSHNKHTGLLTCANCHVDNGTSPAGNNHADGNIQIASPLRGVTGESYGQATHAVSNSPIFASCTTYCHSQGTSKTSNPGDTHTSALTAPNTTLTWGTANANGCTACHNTPPDYASGTLYGGAAKANSHGGHVSAGVTTCTSCHSSVTGTGPYTLTTGHADGLYTINSGLGYTYAAVGGTCATAGCHGSRTWGAALGCIDCHNSVVTTSSATQTLDATVTSRPIITTNFTLTSSHTRSRASKTATSQDCCVCHMEGDVATGAKNATYHGNAYVELRDADTGSTILAVTHSANGVSTSAGAYADVAATPAKFVRFKRNLAATLEAETATIPGTTITNFQVLGGIMKNHCLKCHDGNGATSTLAQLPAGSGGSAFKPFGATVAANGTNQGVLDVATQFLNTNRAYHPVLSKQNSGYTNTGGTRMNAPWNGVTKTGTTTVYGPLISCWDCHAPNGAAAAITTSGAHGATPTGTDVVQLRGSVYTNSATTTNATNLCTYCHVVTGNTTNHGTGSAITSSTNGSMTYFSNRCYFCHSGNEATAKPARPQGAGDVHGYNTTAAGAAMTTAGRGYAFIRRTGLNHLVKQVGATTFSPTCNGTGICSNSMGGYTPGGVY